MPQVPQFPTGAAGSSPLGDQMPSQQNLLMAAADMHQQGRLVDPSRSMPGGQKTPVEPVPRNVRKKAHRLTIVK